MNAPVASVAPSAVTLAPGGQIHTDRALKPVRVAVLTISDTRDEESDTSGHVLADRVTGAGHILAARGIVKDDVAVIRSQVKAWTTSGEVDAIVTTGGTGITGRDVTPEAIEPLLDKRIEGFSVIFHLVSYQTVGLSTLQSRALAGIIDGVFIFCLPGSNGAVRDGWDKVIAAQLDSRHGPCNMVELMPRLMET
ncbi:MAG TPA: molybdenum cofactor biosynthesis protein B [Caulobacteraceae bacterium]